MVLCAQTLASFSIVSGLLYRKFIVSTNWFVLNENSALRLVLIYVLFNNYNSSPNGL